MNIFQRFWYSVFELISNKSNFRDIPYAGTALVLFILIEVFVLTIVGYWKCFSIIFGAASISLRYSRILWSILLCIPFPIIYLHCKKMGMKIIERFKGESELSLKKRRHEAKLVIIFNILLLIGALIWRIYLEN